MTSQSFFVMFKKRMKKAYLKLKKLLGFGWDSFGRETWRKDLVEGQKSHCSDKLANTLKLLTNF